MQPETAQLFPRVFWIDSPTHGRYATTADTADEVREQFHRGFPGLDEEPAVTPGDWDAVGSLADRGIGPIVDPCEWEPHKPDGQPYTYLRIKRVKTVREVCNELAKYLSWREDNQFGSHWTNWIDGLEEGLHVFPTIDSAMPWPHNARIAVFSVRGGSEGDYVHVEALDDRTTTLLLLVAKTFQGRDATWTAARRIADLLGV